ncbi:MAG: hypothetical protein KKF50_01300 [Nanoarchaeota archaeon]|nr:hypothetical protein [Nanoarchaeota archaeon]
MVIKQNRKSSQQIKEEILSQLELQPLSVEQLRKNIKDSNWSTVNKYLEELKEDARVREIVSTDKIKIYQKIMGDTYFDLPITENQRKKFHSLFAMIFAEYKKRNKMPTKTSVAKCAVHVIDNEKAELKDLPIVWYLYGMVPLMAVETTTEYSEGFILEKRKEIQKIIIEFVDENGEKRSSQIQKEQHKRYNEETYVLSDEIFEILNKPEFDNKEILSLLSKFFIACPVDQEFLEIFDLTNSVIAIIQKMDLMNLSLQQYRKEILLAFDSLWKFIALYKLYKSRTEGIKPMKKEIILNFYLGGAIGERKRGIGESLSELNSIYFNKLADFDVDKIELSEDVKEIRKIMENWTGED